MVVSAHEPEWVERGGGKEMTSQKLEQHKSKLAQVAVRSHSRCNMSDIQQQEAKAKAEDCWMVIVWFPSSLTTYIPFEAEKSGLSESEKNMQNGWETGKIAHKD